MAGPELTNPRSSRVKEVRQLATRASRHEQRQFLAEGAQAVREALMGARSRHVVVHDLYVTKDGAGRDAELVPLAESLDIPVHLSSNAVAAALSDTVTPQGLVAVCGFVDRPLTEVVTSSSQLVALLAEVRDPGNAGSVIRAADAAGADSVVFSTDCVDPYNGKVVRASVGGLFHVPFAFDIPLAEAVGVAQTAGLQVLAADGSGDLDLDTAERDGTLAGPTAWLFGNEAWGLPAAVRSAADAVVRIPIYGRAESLNLATAAALCLYASARAQRTG